MRIRIRIRIWIRNPGGGGIYKSLSPSLSLSFFFPISLSTTVCSPFYFLPSPLYLPSFLLLSFSLSLFLLEYNCYLSSSLPSYFSSFLYIPFFMIQIVTKQMLAITTCSPPLSPPSSSPYLLLISFLSTITDYHCIAMVAWTSPLPPITRGGGGVRRDWSLSLQHNTKLQSFAWPRLLGSAAFLKDIYAWVHDHPQHRGDMEWDGLDRGGIPGP